MHIPFHTVTFKQTECGKLPNDWVKQVSSYGLIKKGLIQCTSLDTNRCVPSTFLSDLITMGEHLSHVYTIVRLVQNVIYHLYNDANGQMHYHVDCFPTNISKVQHV